VAWGDELAGVPRLLEEAIAAGPTVVAQRGALNRFNSRERVDSGDADASLGPVIQPLGSSD
jgi:hypothetical protein